jgi:hypothetical protein
MKDWEQADFIWTWIIFTVEARHFILFLMQGPVHAKCELHLQPEAHHLELIFCETECYSLVYPFSKFLT